ncbi:MAG: helix-turn-helix domain-containing protein, partial [candidate division Zixibacteria bacterium]|nr:helix-turn-helix domain-containing protein [candidate division Zixibacteria bacterium]
MRLGKTPQKVALRARIVLLVAAGQTHSAIARQLEVSRPTVLLWRDRFEQGGVNGLLRDAPRPGRKKAISE